MKRGMSLFQKTGLLSVCLFGVIAVLTSVLAASMLFERMSMEYMSKGTAIAKSISHSSQAILLRRDAAEVQADIDQYLDIEGVAYVFVVDGDNDVLAHTFVPGIPDRLLPEIREKDGSGVREFELPRLGAVIDIGMPVLAGVAGYVHVGMDKGLLRQYFWNAVLKMQGFLFAVFLACVLILYWVTRRISRPLAQLTEYARQVAAHDFSGQLDLHAQDEVGMLGDAMQAMASELSVLFSDMEQEVAKSTRGLRENMYYLSAIIDNLADGLLVISPLGEVTLINPVMREFFDLDSDEGAGEMVGDIFPEEVSALAMRICRSARGTQSAEIKLARNRIGKAVGSSIVVEDRFKECLGGVLLVRDITREKELDQLKTDFITTVSHELRTPMTSVFGFAKIVRKRLAQKIFPALCDRTELEPSIRRVNENIQIIVDESARLTELINDVLDIAKMEAGKVEWSDQLVDLVEVVQQSVNVTRALWDAKGLEVEVNVAERLPTVHGDKGRLIQVVVNLLSNAVKFTEEGPIVCSVSRENDNVIVTVSDNGIGIPRDALDDVFVKFKQVGDTLTDKPVGTGLGLPISRQIVEHHGGRIWVESRLGQGAIFSFSLPANRLDEDARDVECEQCQALIPIDERVLLVESGESDKPLVLIVDDDTSFIGYLSEVFEEAGFRTCSATSGSEALAQAHRLMPTLISMDLMMEGLNGHDAIKCLRSSPYTCHIPILVVSALGDAVQADGDALLVKPVDEELLIELARDHVARYESLLQKMVIGDEGDRDSLTVGADTPQHVSYISRGQLKARLADGFHGTVYVPADLAESMALDELARYPWVAVVVLPSAKVCE